MSWPLVRLGDVAPAKASKHAFAKSDEVWTLNLDQVEADTGKVLQKIMAPVSEAGSSTHGFDERHVLYSKLRPYLNKVVLPDEKGLATTELVPMLPDVLRLDRKYLSYYLRSKNFVDWVSSQVAGAKMPRVSMQLFWQHEIPLPPLPEQKRIAAILDKADAIRRKRQQAIQLADDFLRAVFLDMFGNPVTNPKGWPVKPLKELSTKIGSGSTPRGGSDAYLEQGISLIRSLNIHDDDFRMKNLAFIDDEQAEKLSNVVVKEGDVLLNITGASVCRCAVVPETILPARVNQHVCIIRTSEAVTSSYLLHLLISAPYKQKLLKMSGAGATREALTKQQVESLEVPVPPKELQVNFEKIKAKVRNLARSSHSFKEESIFESLGNKAFSGQL